LQAYALVAPDLRLMVDVEPRSFLGVALDSATKKRIAGVSFYLPDLKSFADSDSLGIVRFRDLPPGWHPILLRRLGYALLRDSIHVSPLTGTVGVYELPKSRFQSCVTVITS
jgi:hypothetical protein